MGTWIAALMLFKEEESGVEVCKEAMDEIKRVFGMSEFKVLVWKKGFELKDEMGSGKGGRIYKERRERKESR